MAEREPFESRTIMPMVLHLNPAFGVPCVFVSVSGQRASLRLALPLLFSPLAVAPSRRIPVDLEKCREIRSDLLSQNPCLVSDAGFEALEAVNRLGVADRFSADGDGRRGRIRSESGLQQRHHVFVEGRHEKKPVARVAPRNGLLRERRGGSGLPVVRLKDTGRRERVKPNRSDSHGI